MGNGNGGGNARVTKKALKPLLVEELVDNGTSTSGVGDANALLDDVGAELLRREGRDVAEELANDGLDEPVVVEVEDVLNDVVSLQSPPGQHEPSISKNKRPSPGDVRRRPGQA